MTWGRIAAVVALVALVLYCRGPSASTVVGDTFIQPDEGWLRYKEVRYEAEWGPEIVHEGDARFIERAKYKSAPFFTHHVVVTTGEFSDPDLVNLRHNGGGNFFWSAPKQPEGTIIVLHLVPLDRDVLDQLQSIDNGDAVKLVGREEVDSRVDGDDGSWLKLGHSNHKYLLVERVR